MVDYYYTSNDFDFTIWYLDDCFEFNVLFSCLLDAFKTCICPFAFSLSFFICSKCIERALKAFVEQKLVLGSMKYDYIIKKIGLVIVKLDFISINLNKFPT